MGGFKTFNPLASKYADLREKQPSLDGFQAIRSSLGEELLIGVAIIASKIDWGRTKERLSHDQFPLSSIKSATNI